MKESSASLEEACWAVSPESRFLPASINSFDQLMGWTVLPPPRQAESPNPLRRRQILIGAQVERRSAR